MSESKEKTTAEVKKEKSDKKSADAVKKNKENIFKRMGKSIKRFFKDFRGECKKITWPTGKTVLNRSFGGCCDSRSCYFRNRPGSCFDNQAACCVEQQSGCKAGGRGNNSDDQHVFLEIIGGDKLWQKSPNGM